MRKSSRLHLVTIFSLMIVVISCVQAPDDSERVVSTITSTITPVPPLTPTATYLPVTPVFSRTEIPSSESVISAENVNRLTLFARWGNGNISDAQYTPDGKYLIATSSIGIYFYRTQDFSLAKFIDLETAIFNIAMTNDGQKMAVTSPDMVFIFDSEKDEPILTINEMASSVAFSPNGQILALGTYHRSESGTFTTEKIKLFDSITGNMILEFKDSDRANTITFSPDGTQIAAGGFTTQIWNLDGKLLDTHGVYVSGGSTRSLSFSQDGTLLAEGADTNNVLHVWRVLENGRLVIFRAISLGDYPVIPIVFEVAISPDRKRLAAATSNGLFIWRLDSGKLIYNHNKNSIDDYTRYFDVAWSPDSNYLTAISKQNGTEVWNVNDGELAYSFIDMAGAITYMAWQPNGELIASATDNGTIILLDSNNGNIVDTFIGDSIENSFAFSPDGNWLAVKSNPFTQEGGVVITKVEDKSYRHVLPNSYGDGLSNPSFSSNGKYLATSGFENGKETIQIWNTSNWSLENTWLVSDKLVNQIIFCPDGETIALVESRASTIKFYQKTDGSLTLEVELLAPLGNPRVNAIAFSPDGQKLLTSSREYETSNDVRKVLRMWQACTKNLIFLNKEIQGLQALKPSPPYYSDIPSSIAWSPNGDLFAVGFADGSVGIFRASDGKLLQTLYGHTMMVMGVVFSPNGHMLASGSLDGTIRLWSVK